MTNPYDPNNPYGAPVLPYSLSKDPNSSQSQAARILINNQLNEAPYIGQEQQLVNSMQNLSPNTGVGKQLWQNQGAGLAMAGQSIDEQKKAYDLAQKYAGGADTAAYTQLGQSQKSANAFGAGAAQSAGGGARGAAAAQGALQDQAGSTTDMQRASLQQQKAQDQQQYTQQAAQLGNQLMGSQLGLAQNQAQYQNAQGQVQGQYQQLGDTASLGAGSMLENVLSQNLGLGTGTAQQNLQQYEQQQQQQQQMYGAGVSGAGSLLAQYGSSGGGGGGGGGGNGPYGLGNGPENPWYNPNP